MRMTVIPVMDKPRSKVSPDSENKKRRDDLMTTWTRNFSLAMSVAILCSGCLAALLTVDTPKVELTKLKSIADDIDI